MKFSHGFFLTLLAIIFTIGLTFLSVELPALVDTFLHRNIAFLDVATGAGAESEYKTELLPSPLDWICLCRCDYTTDYRRIHHQ